MDLVLIMEVEKMTPSGIGVAALAIPLQKRVLSEKPDSKITPFPLDHPKQPKLTGAFLFAYEQDGTPQFGVVYSITGDKMHIEKGLADYKAAEDFARQNLFVPQTMSGYSLREELTDLGYDHAVALLPKSL